MNPLLEPLHLKLVRAGEHASTLLDLIDKISASNEDIRAIFSRFEEDVF
jgi:hypothetical protein